MNHEPKDYKKFYERVGRIYPFVTNHLDPVIPITDMKQLPDLLDRFIAASGSTREEVHRNFHDARILFVSLSVRMSDPLFYEFNSRAKYRLILSLAKLLHCDKSQILYNLRKSKNYWKVYPEFRDKVNELYSKIIEE